MYALLFMEWDERGSPFDEVSNLSICVLDMVERVVNCG